MCNATQCCYTGNCTAAVEFKQQIQYSLLHRIWYYSAAQGLSLKSKREDQGWAWEVEGVLVKRTGGKDTTIIIINMMILNRPDFLRLG